MRPLKSRKNPMPILWLTLAILLAGCAVPPERPSPPPPSLDEIVRHLEPVAPHEVQHTRVDPGPASPDEAQSPATDIAGYLQSLGAAQVLRPDTTPDTEDAETHSADWRTTDVAIWPRVVNGFALPGKHHDRVQPHLQEFKRRKTALARTLARAEPYFYHIVEAVERRGMPLEIALLPVVESAFQPFAYSHSRAAGIWQFIPATARRYGLTIDWWSDQRRDILSATRAALDYLQFLHDEFDGDWLLALAAYNSGEGTVMRALRHNRRRGHDTTFWSLKLPKETRGYVPKLLAVATLIAEPNRFHLVLPHIPDRPLSTLVGTQGQIDVALAAKLAGLSIEQIYRLNPGINRWATHPDGPHHLLLPWTHAVPFAQALARVPSHQRVRWTRHIIQRGEALQTIARRFGTTAEVLRRTNRLTGSLIRAGDELIIPVAQKSLDAYVLSTDQRLARRPPPRPGDQRRIHTVRRGDTLWDIARQYGVGVRTLARWNNLATRAPLRVGQRLVIWQRNTGDTSTAPPSSLRTRRIHYTVRPGDSLARIAKKFNVSIRDLQTWNAAHLKQRQYLQPGQKLIVYVDVTRHAESG